MHSNRDSEFSPGIQGTPTMAKALGICMESSPQKLSISTNHSNDTNLIQATSTSSNRSRKNKRNKSTMNVKTGHEDMIHDARLNFLGNTLATASADKAIRIFEINTNSGYQKKTAELNGHQGEVLQLSWAHHKFGNVLASCSDDRTVIVWKEVIPGTTGHSSSYPRTTPGGQNSPKWEKQFIYDGHKSSVNCVSWAPPEFGLVLACGSSDTSLSVSSFSENRWSTIMIPDAHSMGCNSVSWCHFSKHTSYANGSNKRFVTGGNDSRVKIWRVDDDEVWLKEDTLLGHSDWVQVVAWAPSTGSSTMKIASGGNDRRVLIWSNSGSNNEAWVPSSLHLFEEVVWNLSWGVSADLIAVSCGESEVCLWKQGITGWECLNSDTGTDKVGK